MKISERKLSVSARLITVLLIITMLNACGSSNSGSTSTAGTGRTGIVVGKITGFGSLFVNGTEFDTNNSRFNIDGNTNATETDLTIGMVVHLKVDIENGIYTGNTTEVEYDDQVQGPVAAFSGIVTSPDGARKSFTVFGQTITIDDTFTIFEDTDFATIAINDVVEISGFRTSETSISASYVRKTGIFVGGSSEVELRGIIGLFSSANQEFQIDGTAISYNILTDIDVPFGLLGNGTEVEVEGIIESDLSVSAKKIEHEEPRFTNNISEVRLQGVITQFISISDFQIDGLSIDASNAALTPNNAASKLKDGANVEVEGSIDNGVLDADELEIRDGDSELSSFVSAIDLVNNRIEVNYAPLSGSVVIDISNQTLFEDDSASELENFSLDLLMIGDFVKLEGSENNNLISADIIKRKDADDSKIQGSVDAFFFNNSITILDIRYQVNPATDYVTFGTATDFFNQLNIGDIVQIKDNAPADGIADEVEFKI